MQLIGLARLGRDAEIRFTNDGEPVASLSLAFEHGRRGTDGKRTTQWALLETGPAALNPAYTCTNPARASS